MATELNAAPPGRAIRGLYGKMAPGDAIGLAEPQDAFFLLSQGSIQKISVGG